MDRRKFLNKSLAIAAGATIVNNVDSLGTNPSMASGYLSFDLHCHPGLFFAKGAEGYSVDAGISKTLSEMKTGNLSGAFFSLVADARIIKIGSDGVKPA